jgi:hypothetical protein
MNQSASTGTRAARQHSAQQQHDRHLPDPLELLVEEETARAMNAGAFSGGWPPLPYCPPVLRRLSFFRYRRRVLLGRLQLHPPQRQPAAKTARKP